MQLEVRLLICQQFSTSTSAEYGVQHIVQMRA